MDLQRGTEGNLNQKHIKGIKYKFSCLNFKLILNTGLLHISRKGSPKGISSQNDPVGRRYDISTMHDKNRCRRKDLSAGTCFYRMEPHNAISLSRAYSMQSNYTDTGDIHNYSAITSRHDYQLYLKFLGTRDRVCSTLYL